MGWIRHAGQGTGFGGGAMPQGRGAEGGVGQGPPGQIGDRARIQFGEGRQQRTTADARVRPVAHVGEQFRHQAAAIPAPDVEAGQVPGQPLAGRLAQQDGAQQVFQDVGESKRVFGLLAQHQQARHVCSTPGLFRPVEQQAPGVFLGQFHQHAAFAPPLGIAAGNQAPRGFAGGLGGDLLGLAAQAEDQAGQVGGLFRPASGHEFLGELGSGGTNLHVGHGIPMPGQSDVDAAFQAGTQDFSPGRRKAPKKPRRLTG
jgi:hypothetical protein